MYPIIQDTFSHHNIILWLNRFRYRCFIKHIPHIYFYGSADLGDRDIVGASFKSVYRTLAHAVEGMKGPGYQGGKRNIEPNGITFQDRTIAQPFKLTQQTKLVYMEKVNT